MRGLGFVLLALTVLLLLGSFWWWALLGMNPDVGYALFVTVITLGLIGAMAYIEGDEP